MFTTTFCKEKLGKRIIMLFTTSGLLHWSPFGYLWAVQTPKLCIRAFFASFSARILANTLLLWKRRIGKTLTKSSPPISYTSKTWPLAFNSKKTPHSSSWRHRHPLNYRLTLLIPRHQKSRYNKCTKYFRFLCILDVSKKGISFLSHSYSGSD